MQNAHTYTQTQTIRSAFTSRQGYGVGVGSLSFEGDFDSGPYLSHLAFCVFFAVCLTFVQFILQLKLCDFVHYRAPFITGI